MEIEVVIATHNHAPSLQATLENLRQQSCDTWRVFVVDNGSTDNTADVIKQMSISLPLRGIHEPIASKARALNVALETTVAEIVACTDDDVEPHREWLAAIIRGFQESESGHEQRWKQVAEWQGSSG
jgi:glycosyltransferase involved in cell wall biosynthesis